MHRRQPATEVSANKAPAAEATAKGKTANLAARKNADTECDKYEVKRDLPAAGVP